MPITRVLRGFAGLRVGQKIGLGYALALGIAVGGTVTGFSIGNFYQQQAARKENHTRNEVELLHRLQTGVLQTRTHQQQLIPLSQNLGAFNEEYNHILHHRDEIQKAWEELKLFAEHEASWHGEEHSEKIPEFLKTYEGIPSQYFQELEKLVNQAKASGLKRPQDITQSQQALLKFTNSELALQYDGVSDDLVDLIQGSYLETQEARQEILNTSVIGQRVMLVSIGLSIAISILLAILTSREIAGPIQLLTAIARRSTERSDFDLQVDIQREDEIGTLAQSFNQLIASVKQLLEQQKIANQQLAEANQTLEQRVEERTQALTDNNLRLEKLLKELHQTQIQMVQSEKMSALGQMVAGIAHEINNPVNFIHGNISHIENYTQDLLELVEDYQRFYPEPPQTLQDRLDEVEIEFLSEDLHKILQSVKVGTDRIREIVLSLRNFSRLDEAECKPVNIHEGLDHTLMILRHRLKARAERPEIQVIKDYGQLPEVECYAGQLNQVFMNLLANSIDAIEECNQQRSYAEITANPNTIRIQTRLTEAQQVEIRISDNGPGIPQEVHSRLFTPFFTTKPVGKGTGLGLSISYQIIAEKHGGKIRCESAAGEGTTFVIEIPVRQAVLVPA